MWNPEWDVLVVDDEPDVLAVTKLIMRNLEVDGVPVRVHTASSKAEAIELLRTEFTEEGGPGTLAVAFIDVVMETDIAGLELCDFIRNQMHNHLTQLYIRTGQPGVAPERSVIDNYNISGYFTKVEANEDKLYTLVKSGVRQFWFTGFSLISVMMLNAAIGAAAVSKESIGQLLTERLNMIADRRGGGAARMVMWAADDPFVLVGYSEEEADATRARLERQPMKPLGSMGEVFTISEETKEGLVLIPEGPNNPPAAFLSSGYGIPDVFVWMMMSWATRSLATLWQQAGIRERM